MALAEHPAVVPTRQRKSAVVPRLSAQKITALVKTAKAKIVAKRQPVVAVEMTANAATAAKTANVPVKTASAAIAAKRKLPVAVAETTANAATVAKAANVPAETNVSAVVVARSS